MKLTKNFLVALLTFCLLTFSFSVYAEENGAPNTVDIRFVIDSATYTVNGTTETMDTVPTIYHNRTVLPIRYVATPLGAAVDWDGVERKVTVELDDIKIEMWIDNPMARVNGNSVSIDPQDNSVKPIIMDSRTMLPVRFVAQTLQCAVKWNPDIREVQILKDGVVAQGPDNPGVSKEQENPNDGPKSPIDSIKPVQKTPISKLGEGHLLNGVTLQQKDPIHEYVKIKKPIYSVENDKELLAELAELKNDFQISDAVSKVDFIPGANWKSAPQNEAITIKSNETVLPIVKRLGRGYNVFGEYASVDALKNVVLDIDKLAADQRLERIRYDSAVNQENVAESIKKYSKQMSFATETSGRYLCFSGSVDINFSSGRTQELNTYFSTYTYLVKKYGVYVKAATHLKDYLLPEARQAINDPNIAADTIFNRYGQYILVDSITGGRVDYSISAKADKSTSFENFSLATSADFNVAVYGGGGTSSVSSVTNKEQYDSSKDERLSSQGGAMGLSLAQFKGDPQTLINWEATLEDNGTLVEFGKVGERALVPIWELCDDGQRAQYLKTEFEKINDSQEQQWPTERYITDVTFVAHRSPDAARGMCPTGYYLIDADLNHAANGLYVFICYQLSEDSTNAITDLFAEYTGVRSGIETKTFTHNGNVADYTRIPVDLNAGAGGYYIYIWKSRANTRTPLREIDVKYSLSNSQQEDWQFIKWLNSSGAADMNRGVGGSYVGILFKR